MKVILLSDEDKKEIIREITKIIYGYIREDMTIRAVISQEIKHYFDEEKRIKEEEDKKLKEKQNENDNAKQH